MSLKIFLSALAGTLTSMIMGATWYNLLDSFYQTHSHRRFEDTKMDFLILGLFVISLVMSIFISKINTEKINFIKGLQIGVLVGIACGFGWGLVTYGVMEGGYDMTGTLVDSGFRVLEFGMAGGVIGYVQTLKK